MQELMLKVTGMTCQGCVRSVQRVLEAVPGVQRAEVSLEQNQALVAFDPGRTDAAQLAAAVASAGYEARVV